MKIKNVYTDQNTFVNYQKANQGILTLRLSRLVDPFEQSNFRYINRKISTTMTKTSPKDRPEEWVKVDGDLRSCEKAVIDLAASLPPDFELNPNSRKVREILAGMMNRVAVLSARGPGDTFIVNPKWQGLIERVSTSWIKRIIYRQECPEDLIISVYTPWKRYIRDDGPFHYVVDAMGQTWLCRLMGQPTDVNWNHYISIAKIVDGVSDDGDDEDEE